MSGIICRFCKNKIIRDRYDLAVEGTRQDFPPNGELQRFVEIPLEYVCSSCFGKLIAGFKSVVRSLIKTKKSLFRYEANWVRVDKYRSLIKRITMMIKLGLQINQFELDEETIFQYEYKNEYLLTNKIKYQKGELGFYSQANIERKRVRIFIIPSLDKFPTSEDFDTFFNKIPDQFIKEIVLKKEGN